MTDLASADSMMTHCADPRQAPELLLLRERMAAWRFYDHLPTDRNAPSRRPQVGTFTPILAHDGRDLAAALQTIVEIGDRAGLRMTLDDAFPGAALAIGGTDGYLGWSCASRACCDHSRPRSCPTARCATCCSPPPCSRPARRH
jgi:predicted ATPase